MQKVFRLTLLTAVFMTAGNSAAVAQGIFSRISVGSHAGLNLDNGEVADGRLGGHVIVSLVGPLELWTGFNAEVDPPVFTTIEGDVTTSFLQGLFAARVRPFGAEGLGSLWYLGYGLTFRRASLKGGGQQPAVANRVDRSSALRIGASRRSRSSVRRASTTGHLRPRRRCRSELVFRSECQTALTIDR